MKDNTLNWRDYAGSVAWVLLLVVVLVMVFIDPDAHSVVFNYRHGSERFLAGNSPYNFDTVGGYIYWPAFAVIFLPFYALGPQFGEALWRILCFAILSYAAVRQARLLDDRRTLWLVSFAFFLSIPLAAGAVRNGQATIMLAGACWLLVLAVLENRWLQTLLWATIALLAKPTAVVVMLLSGAMRPRAIPLLVLAAVILIVLPFGFASFDYAMTLNRDYMALMTIMSLGETPGFHMIDFTAPFIALGIDIPPTLATGIRAAAALPTLAAVLWFARNGGAARGLAIISIATWYMCVFNPRVELNTYGLLAVPFGLSIALMVREEGMTAFALILGAGLFFSGFTGVEPHVMAFLDNWFQPTISTLLFAPLVWWHWRRARRLPSGAFATPGARQS